MNQLKLKEPEIISWLRLNSQSWKIIDGINILILCIMFVTWIQKSLRTTLRELEFRDYQAKMGQCDLLHCFMFHDKKLAGIRRFYPSLCCLQGIRVLFARHSPQPAVLGMSLRKVTLLGSVTLLCCDFWGYNSLARWQSSGLSPSLNPWLSLSPGNLSKGCTRRSSKV